MNALAPILKYENLAIPFILMSSYLYERGLNCPLRDSEFDKLCRYVKRRWLHLNHRHKVLIQYDQLDAGHPIWAYPQDYPKLIQMAALTWSNQLHEGIL